MFLLFLNRSTEVDTDPEKIQSTFIRKHDIHLYLGCDHLRNQTALLWIQFILISGQNAVRGVQDLSCVRVKN